MGKKWEEEEEEEVCRVVMKSEKEAHRIRALTLRAALFTDCTYRLHIYRCAMQRGLFVIEYVYGDGFSSRDPPARARKDVVSSLCPVEYVFI